MKRKRAGQSTQASLDLISDLPKDVMDLIFVRMPIRDAIRTSVLSKKWRYKWVSIPDVVFDKDCLTEGASEIERAHIVDQVLLHHVGPICKFSCTSYVLPCSHIGRWIVFLSRSGIKKLILLVKFQDGYYNLPSSIFFCQELHHLELVNCKLKVPPTFKGFHNLLVLNLAVYTLEDDITRLISRCPLLEKLKLDVWCHHHYRCFNIHAPNLRCLELTAIFEGLSLGSSPLLTNMSIDLCIYYERWRNLRQGNICSLNQLIGYSHGIERLALKGKFLQFLSTDGVPEKLSTTCDHLKYLEIHINSNSKVILGYLCILRSSPNLKELKIRYIGGGEDLYEVAELWGGERQFDCLFSHLQAAEIIDLGTIFGLQFIRHILSNAPTLKTMKIYTTSYVEDEGTSMFLKEMLRFPRASSRAEIIYLGHYKDAIER
ncbi:F-box/FBD/LRR-repeat-like protein isoform X1 [Cinnamomum micranthum f. kanehirae]|uniref:F-box/FBD/LRR-repeat-like protein isoform X1 n=1 Tax=Cinnamomum micranthum f. kanehirae TaxID=337451 RepID=A0A443NR11_9MAGN|nr:F-box/FBD/LRR-repeat-like protein isoform X1 [Cinnamomum micranthum f. kanehirae]